MATKLGTMVTYLEGSYPLNDMLLRLRGLARSHDKLKLLYLYTKVTMANKLDRMRTYLDKILPIKLGD